MHNTIRAVFRNGRIELLEEIELPEGTEILMTPLIDDSDSRVTGWRICASAPQMNRLWTHLHETG